MAQKSGSAEGWQVNLSQQKELQERMIVAEGKEKEILQFMVD